MGDINESKNNSINESANDNLNESIKIISIDKSENIIGIDDSTVPSVVKRTPQVLAAEINTIKYQTGKMLLSGLTEIGGKLAEVKTMIPHGQWGKWLEKEVSYSKKTAQNLIRLYEEYAKAEPGAQALVQDMPGLTYCRALVLLGVPEQERVQLFQELDVENMSIRELKVVTEAYRDARQENENLRIKLDDAESRYTVLVQERDQMKAETDGLQKSKRELEQTVKNKTLENKKLAENSEYKSYNRVSNQLAAAQIKLLTSQVAFKLEGLIKAYQELNYEMKLLGKIDQEVHDAYAKKVYSFFIRVIEKRVGQVGAEEVVAGETV